MSDWYDPLLKLDSSAFINSLQGRSSEDLSEATIPYSSANINNKSELFRSAELMFGAEAVSHWTLLHWVVYRLMLLRDELIQSPAGPDVAKMQRAREAFKNNVITWFRNLKQPTHQVVLSLSEMWPKRAVEAFAE